MIKIMRYILVLLLFLTTDVIVATETYRFAIVPQQAASKIVKNWAPIMEYLTKKTGHKLNITTAKNITLFEKGLKNGAYDFAYMNPYHYIVFQKTSKYKAFAKAKDKNIHGIMIVRKDSHYKSLSELENNKLAFPSPLAFAASILTRRQLSKNKIAFTPVYVSSHDSVYLNVVNKNFIAGGGVIRTLKAMEKDVREKLRILYKTPGYTPHAFAAHPRVPENVIKDIQMAMIGMESDLDGIVLLKKIKLKGLVSANNNDWDDVRNIGIE